MLVSAASLSGSIAGEPPEKKKSSSSSSSLSILPDEVVTSCFARVPRSYYPSISLVSKTFNRLINSPEIYIERSIINRAEPVVYVVLRSHATETPRWYTLNQKYFKNESESVGISNRLVPVPSFPSIPYWGMSIVSLGSSIYVIGGCVNGELVSTVFVVECPSHKCRVLPSMKQARGCAAAGFVDGKIYVVGGCSASSVYWIEAFDLVKETWESVLVSSNVEVYEKTIRSVVVDNKMYIMDRKNSFIYDPRGGSLVSDHLLDNRWRVGSCVVDDKLYTFGCRNKICAFDPITRVWCRVKGLEALPEMPNGSRMANHGGKLAILYNLEKFATEILCVEVELEIRNGQIWGTILSSELAFYLKEASSTIVQALAVTF